MPVTTATTELRDLPVMLSASLPTELNGTNRAQDLYDLLVVLATGILTSGGRLVFGGHPSVTPLIHRITQSAGARQGQITLFQLEQFRYQAPIQIQDRSVFGEVRWCKDLQEMRDGMAAMAEAGVFVGGKTSGSVGGKPGIRDEFERFVARHPCGPVYLGSRNIFPVRNARCFAMLRPRICWLAWFLPIWRKWWRPSHGRKRFSKPLPWVFI